jgi:hypothetical protein
MLCCFLALSAGARVCTQQLSTVAYFVTSDKNKAVRTNKEKKEYQQVLAYLRQIYPINSFGAFCQLFDQDNIIKIFALLGFCDQQQNSLQQIEQMTAGFKVHLQQQTQIQDFGAHCAEHSGCDLPKEKLELMINDILKAYLFMVHYCIKMYPPVQNPADSIKERIRTDLQSQLKRMRIGSAILVQIPLAEKVFSKEEEFEAFRKCTTMEEIEKKVQAYEMSRTKNISPEAHKAESESTKYAIILKGENQPLSLPPTAPPIFQEAIDQSIAEGKPVCVEYKGKGPNGEAIEVGICALAHLSATADLPQAVPEELVLQLSQAEAAGPFMKPVLTTATRAVRMESV